MSITINNKKITDIKSNKTKKFNILDVDQNFLDKFHIGQYYYAKVYRYGLQFLTRNYGYGHLDKYLPTSGMNRNVLVGEIKKYYWSKGHFKGKYNSHSLNKLLESLIVCFSTYRVKQERASEWSDRRIKRYEHTHQCSIRGYGRLTYPHENDHFKTLVFKKENRSGRIIDSHHIQIPYFGVLHIKQNLDSLLQKKLVEFKVQQTKNNAFILQIGYEFKNKRRITKQDIKQIVGADINSKDDKIITLSDGTVYTLPNTIKEEYDYLDRKCRQLQAKITNLIKIGRRNKLYRQLQFKKSKIEYKRIQIIDNWEREIAKELANKYPVLAIERLQSSGITIKKYKKDMVQKVRKNINFKWNFIVRPYTFRQHIEDAYRNSGGLLIEIEPSFTSKTCNFCGTIYNNLGSKKKWFCPNPRCPYSFILHDRDLNAARNIRDWALDITKHIVLVKNIKRPWIRVNDMFTII